MRFYVVSFFLLLSVGASLPAFAGDRETPQVKIEAKIVEASNAQVRDLGVHWDHPSDSAEPVDLGRIRGLEHVSSGQRSYSGQFGDFLGVDYAHATSGPRTEQKTVSDPQQAGVELSVTPQVNEKGQIEMQVKPTVTEVTELKQEKSVQAPLLSNIPVAGMLFKKPSEESKKKDLLIFVTPRIIQPSED